MTKRCDICKRKLDDEKRDVCDDCILKVLKQDKINLKQEVKQNGKHRQPK